MDLKENICQSCGMPLNQDPKGGGINADGSISHMYCSFCFDDGKFKDEGITLQEKIEKNVGIAVSMHMAEDKARKMAERILPTLKRWKTT